MKNDYCVIGIGGFGTEVVKQLVALKMKVLAVDSVEEKLNSVEHLTTHSVVLDPTDIDALKDAGVDKMENVIVAISKNMEESILTCANLVELKIPNIIVKASNSRHEKILKAVGITNVVLPDIEAAKRMVYRSVLNIGFDVNNINKKYFFSTAIIKNPELTKLEISKLQLKDKNILNLCFIKRDNEILIPHGSDFLHLEDEITYIGETKSIKNIESYLLQINSKS